MSSPRLQSKYVTCLVVGLLIIGILLITAGTTDESRTAFVATLPEALVGGAVEDKDLKVVTTEDVVAGQYYSRGSNSSWVTSGVLSWVARGTGDLVSYDTQSGEKTVVIKAGQFTTRPWKTHFSKDLENVLVAFSPQRVFRSTILARYAVHSGTTGDLVATLTTDPSSTEPQMFQLGLWANDNKTIMLVYKNDVFAVRIDKDNPGNSPLIKRFTYDGSDAIFNGIADWVFEEEIFVSTSTAVYSSSTGEHVCYLKFNDTVVEQINYNLYGDYSAQPYDEYFQYPRYGSVRYPKSGRRNPTVSIHIVNIGDPTCLTTTPTPSQCTWDLPLNPLMTLLTRVKDNFIIAQFKWLESTPSSFTLLVFNRIQNKSWLLECSTTTKTCKIVRSMTQENGWIDNAPLFVHKHAYVTLASVPQSDNLSYMHVVAYTPEVTRMYTRGTYSVDEIVQVSPVHGRDLLVFKAPLLNIDKVGSTVSLSDPAQSHYYALDLGGLNSLPVCLTCSHDCTFNAGKFSGSEFVNTCERVHGVSTVQLVTINPDLSTTVTKKFEENKYLSSLLSDLQLPEVEYTTIPYEFKGKVYNLSVKTIGPHGWKLGNKHKYPVIMDQYSGPNSQKVTKRMTANDWSYSLASNIHNPVVYVIVDGIGSGRQSSSMAFEIYRNMGEHEIFDKVYAMKTLLSKHESLDPERTLIWGWSYGGYVSSMMMGRDTENVFKCGISVAPVVNWYYYDTMYTERYMSTPQDNPVGYNTSNVLRYVDNFASKKYLLVHGNADDNVHYQQTMTLSRALEQRAILFRMQSYPDENHSLGGVRLHLFRTLEDFVFNTCFRR